jgi:hypothetical protein
MASDVLDVVKYKDFYLTSICHCLVACFVLDVSTPHRGKLEYRMY